MKKAGIIVFVLLLIGAAGLIVHHFMTTPREEGVAHLKTVSSVPYLNEYDVVNFFWALDKEPESLTGMPENVGGKKTFFAIPFARGPLLCCLFDQGGRDYLVYADVNGNNSLADETPLRCRKRNYRGGDSIYLFGPLANKGLAEAPFYLFFTNFTGGIHIAPTTIQKGRIRIDRTIHRIMLADLDFDGQYQTHFSAECLRPNTLSHDTLCDQLLFDIDQDGKFLNTYFIQMECMPLPKVINIHNRYYAVDLTDKKLLAAPAMFEFGTLKLNTLRSTLHLYSDTYSCFIFSTDTAKLPPGRYSIVSSHNNFADPNEDVWTCHSMRGSVYARDFEIAPNSEIQLAFPTCFLLTTDVSYKEGSCSIGVRLVDSHKVAYSAAIQKNAHTVAEPVITIYDQQHAVIHSGTMEYG